MNEKQKGRIVQSTIMASLLYGCEAVGYSAKHYEVIQRFVGRIIRAIKMSKELTIKDMKGRLTQTDLRLRAKLDTVRVQVMSKTLGVPWPHGEKRHGET